MGRPCQKGIGMTPEKFAGRINLVVDAIGGRALDDALASFLNEQFPPQGRVFSSIRHACELAIAEGWMCNRDAGGIRYGRVIGPTLGPHSFSVDVVNMADVAGPHHSHPLGEIDMIMPITPSVAFDRCPAGWLVYPPKSAHSPTVTGGEALILYLLPKGEINFSPKTR